MKSFFILTILGILAIGCGRPPNNAANASSENGTPNLPGDYSHQVGGSYSATISIGGGAQFLSDGYSFEFNEDGSGNLSGRHNFQGIQSGYKEFSGTHVGNDINYVSIACANDTFSGTFNLVSGSGSFSGTICGYMFSGGTLTGMVQSK